MEPVRRPLPYPSLSAAGAELALDALDRDVDWSRLVRREVWRHRIARVARPSLESAIGAVGACAAGMLAAAAIVLLMRTLAYVF